MNRFITADEALAKASPSVQKAVKANVQAFALAQEAARRGRSGRRRFALVVAAVTLAAAVAYLLLRDGV